jgi:hypothetical protein
MSDVTVAAALVEGGEDPLYLFLRISRVGTLPARTGPLLQVGGVLGPAARLDAGPGGSPVTGSLRDVLPRPVRTIRLIRVAPELGHAVSIAARATAWLAPMPGQVP